VIGLPRWASLAEARSLFADGQTVSVGGLTLYRRPMALVRELLRSGVKNLTLLSFTSGLESDLLVGAGRVATVRTCYFGLDVFGLAPRFTELATKGTVKVIEETEGTLAQGFAASLGRVGFLPVPGIIGTDILNCRPDLRLVTCPYTGQRMVAVPALRPNVALIHASCADEAGNVFFGGNLAMDREAALLANHALITVEKIIPRGQLPEGAVDLPATGNHILIHAPGGSRPSSCHPDVGLDGKAFLAYMEAATTGRFDQYLEEFIQ
jgi:glutaconate CoA-transferase subunit A